METDNAGTVQATYAYGNDLISMRRADANSFYHYDGLGSTRQLTDDAGGVVASYTYDSFGNSVVSVSSVANSYGFTGEQQLNEADNMVYLRARYYSPSIGRFMSRDPLEYIDSMSLYMYALNNPVILTDPMGDFAIAPIVIGGGVSCYLCAREIRREYLDKYPPSGETPETNFMRHCEASCEVSKQCAGGRACALAVGWGHEWRHPGPGRKEDVEANSSGRAASGCGSCESACKNAFDRREGKRCGGGPC